MFLAFFSAFEPMFASYGRFFASIALNLVLIYIRQIGPNLVLLMQKIVRSSRVVAREHSKVSKTCSEGLTYFWTNKVHYENAYFWAYSLTTFAKCPQASFRPSEASTRGGGFTEKIPKPITQCTTAWGLQAIHYRHQCLLRLLWVIFNGRDLANCARIC